LAVSLLLGRFRHAGRMEIEEQAGERRKPDPPALTQEELDALLAFLGADREQAGESYEKLRRKVIKLLECRGAAFPEDLADEALNRMARRLAEGVTIEARDPYSYLWSIAVHVHRESLRRSPLPAVPSPIPADPLLEHRLKCLDQCLIDLSEGDRNLILEYHKGEKQAKIAGRARLAARQGIGINALRIRVCRLRRQLEVCVRDCLQIRAGS